MDIVSKKEAIERKKQLKRKFIDLVVYLDRSLKEEDSDGILKILPVPSAPKGKRERKKSKINQNAVKLRNARRSRDKCKKEIIELENSYESMTRKLQEELDKKINDIRTNIDQRIQTKQEELEELNTKYVSVKEGYEKFIKECFQDDEIYSRKHYAKLLSDVSYMLDPEISSSSNNHKEREEKSHHRSTSKDEMRDGEDLSLEEMFDPTSFSTPYGSFIPKSSDHSKHTEEISPVISSIREKIIQQGKDMSLYHSEKEEETYKDPAYCPSPSNSKLFSDSSSDEKRREKEKLNISGTHGHKTPKKSHLKQTHKREKRSKKKHSRNLSGWFDM